MRLIFILMNKYLKLAGKIDWIMVVAVVLLISLGLLLIYSTSASASGMFDYANLKKQILAVAIGIIFFILLVFIDYKLFKNFAYFLYILMIVLLVAVLIFGSEIRGTKGWFNFGFFQFQPAELAKIILLIILAKYFASISGKLSMFRHIIISGIITFIPVGLIMMQPDFGSALVLVFLWFVMLFISGIKRNYIAILGGSGTFIGWIVWQFVFKDYQKERILTFLHPNRDPLGSGYNIIQSKIAVGSGGLLGKGLGYGSQSQLKFLPAQQTDFIFAALSEELGFFGGLLLLTLFFILLLRIINISKNSRDEFGLMIGIGAVLILIFQILVNVGMNMGLLPVTGIPLPFVSYGGSSLISILILMGILQSVYVRNKGLTFE